MQSFTRIMIAGVVLAGSFSGQALALECKSQTVTASSRLYVSKSFGAYPGSWAAWRKKVKEELGNGWQAWRRAREPKIECDRVANARGAQRWQCTRSGIPCRPGSGGGEPPNDPLAMCDNYPVIKTRLQRGSYGDQVRMLQCLLKVQGYNVEIDGRFGSSTRDAVRAFQQKNGLTVDGVVGDLTNEKLAG